MSEKYAFLFKSERRAIVKGRMIKGYRTPITDAFSGFCSVDTEVLEIASFKSILPMNP